MLFQAIESLASHEDQDAFTALTRALDGFADDDVADRRLMSDLKHGGARTQFMPMEVDIDSEQSRAEADRSGLSGSRTLQAWIARLAGAWSALSVLGGSMFPVSEGSIVEFLLEGEARVGVVVELEQGKSLVQVAGGELVPGLPVSSLTHITLPLLATNALPVARVVRVLTDFARRPLPASPRAGRLLAAGDDLSAARRQALQLLHSELQARVASVLRAVVTSAEPQEVVELIDSGAAEYLSSLLFKDSEAREEKGGKVSDAKDQLEVISGNGDHRPRSFQLPPSLHTRSLLSLRASALQEAWVSKLRARASGPTPGSSGSDAGAAHTKPSSPDKPSSQAAEAKSSPDARKEVPVPTRAPFPALAFLTQAGTACLAVRESPAGGAGSDTNQISVAAPIANLTLAEAKLKNYFFSLDRDGDGKIPKTEFVANVGANADCAALLGRASSAGPKEIADQMNDGVSISWLNFIHWFANPRWVCEQCTLLNSPAEAQCNACEGARPPTQPQWSCVNCTFSNPDNALVCVVCARSRLQLAAGDNEEAKVAGDGKSASILSPTSDAKSGEETKETGCDYILEDSGLQTRQARVRACVAFDETRSLSPL